MEYLLKASAIIAIFYICYKIFLQGETFFESNRWFLLAGLFTAFTIPFVVIPIYTTQTAIEIPNAAFTTTVSKNTVDAFSFLEIISILYLLGVFLFTFRFTIQIWSLFKLFVKTDKQKQGNYIFAKTENNVSPFSFFKWIVYNPNQFKKDELTQILTHEKVHVSQYHSIDIIISQIAAIAFWFNPFIWLYKKDLQQNLEFIADYSTQNKVDCKKSYQYLLLKSSVPKHQLALTNNFYNSLIKKRIVMLHKSKSKKTNQFKYLVIIPLLAIFLMSFNTKEIIIDSLLEPVYDISASSISKGDQMVIITKDFTGADFEKVKNKLEKEGVSVKFKGIKRNDSGEITAIKIDVSSKQSNANYNINGDDPIKSIKISFDREGGNISIGNTSVSSFTYTSDDSNHIIPTNGEGENQFHFSDEDGEDVKVHIVKSHKNGKVHVISAGNEVIDIDTQSDVDVDVDVDEEIIIELHPDNEEDIIIIRKYKDGNIVKEEIKKSVKKNVLIMKDNGSLKVDITKEVNKAIITNSGKDKPFILLDGEEITDTEMSEIDPDTIEKVNVLKGDNATEKYGDKAKNGLITITTK